MVSHEIGRFLIPEQREIISHLKVGLVGDFTQPIEFVRNQSAFSNRSSSASRSSARCR